MTAAGPLESWQKFYEPLFEIAAETACALGDEAGRFVEIANDWLDIHGALFDCYPLGALHDSLTYMHFQGAIQGVLPASAHVSGQQLPTLNLPTSICLGMGVSRVCRRYPPSANYR